MAKPQIEDLLANHRKEIQNHQKSIKELEYTLEYQRLMRTEKTIPKAYTPRLLQTTNNQLTETFLKEYHALFFQHLNKVIENNSINLELHSAALNSIITQAEQELATSGLETKVIAEMYYTFTSENNLQNHTPIPVLQMLINKNKPTASQTSTSDVDSAKKRKRKRHQKRKSQEPHPAPTKCHKPNHPVTDVCEQHQSTIPFLEQRRLHSNHPP